MAGAIETLNFYSTSVDLLICYIYLSEIKKKLKNEEKMSNESDDGRN